MTQRFARSPVGSSGEFCPYPSKWLNEGRYDDDPAAWNRSDSPPVNGHAHPSGLTLAEAFPKAQDYAGRWHRLEGADRETRESKRVSLAAECDAKYPGLRAAAEFAGLDQLVDPEQDRFVRSRFEKAFREGSK